MSKSKALPLTARETDAVPCCPPLEERPLTPDEAERAAAMFKARFSVSV